MGHGPCHCSLVVQYKSTDTYCICMHAFKAKAGDFVKLYLLPDGKGKSKISLVICGVKMFFSLCRQWPIVCYAGSQMDLA